MYIFDQVMAPWDRVELKWGFKVVQYMEMYIRNFKKKKGGGSRIAVPR